MTDYPDETIEEMVARIEAEDRKPTPYHPDYANALAAWYERHPEQVDGMHVSGDPYAEFRLIGQLYDVLHSAGWRWANLTSGEQADFQRQVEPVVKAMRQLSAVPSSTGEEMNVDWWATAMRDAERINVLTDENEILRAKIAFLEQPQTMREQWFTDEIERLRDGWLTSNDRAQAAMNRRDEVAAKLHEEVASLLDLMMAEYEGSREPPAWMVKRYREVAGREWNGLR